jgi:predicted HNH restriction endonuclease
MPAKRDWTPEALMAKLVKEREQARIRMARMRARRPMRVCVICGETPVDVHHRRGRKAGNGPDNLVVLCPNHHAMVHRRRMSLLPVA